MIKKGINMEERLLELFNESILELQSIGINPLDREVGEIDINFAKRNAKRYGCCRYEDPDPNYIVRFKKGYRVYKKYARYNKHHIEISKWVMDLDDKIVKNTIIHEIIHCFPYCVDHGEQFKAYAKVINEKLGYNITRLGNKKEDYEKSNVEFTDEKKHHNYEIRCLGCNYTVYRQRVAKNFARKYRCGLCGGKFEVKRLTNENVS